MAKFKTEASKDDPMFLEGLKLSLFRVSLHARGLMVRGAKELSDRLTRGLLCLTVASFGNDHSAGSRTTISPGTDCELCFYQEPKRGKWRSRSLKTIQTLTSP
jgi:hypothetical protein